MRFDRTDADIQYLNTHPYFITPEPVNDEPSSYSGIMKTVSIVMIVLMAVLVMFGIRMSADPKLMLFLITLCEGIDGGMLGIDILYLIGHGIHLLYWRHEHQNRVHWERW